MNKPKFIVIHTVAKRGKTNIEIIRKWHVEDNGWNDIGYHFYIKKGGEIQNGRDLETEGAHALGFNSKSVGVCIEGHGDHEFWTYLQWIALRTLVHEMRTIYGTGDIPIENVIGHHETYTMQGKASPKTCPGAMIEMDFVRMHL